MITSHEICYHLEPAYMLGYLVRHVKMSKLETKLSMNRHEIFSYISCKKIKEKKTYDRILQEYYHHYRKYNY